jgi:hypothetical protein
MKPLPTRFRQIAPGCSHNVLEEFRDESQRQKKERRPAIGQH